MQKRVGLVIFSLSGGAGQVNTTLAEYFDAQGLRVSLIFTNGEARLIERLRADTNVELVQTNTRNVPFHALRVARLLSGTKYDRVMVNSTSLFFPLYILLKPLKKQRLYLRIPSAIQPRVDSYGPVKRMVRWWVAWISLRVADRVIANSEGTLWDAISISQSVAAKGTYVYNPLPQEIHSASNTSVVDRGMAGELTRVLNVGILEKQKDQATLLRAFALVRDELDAVELTIVGEGSLRKALERLAQSLGIEDVVNFAGYSSDTPKYYSRADVFVLSSIYEGFGVVVVEALSHGCSVVCTDCPHGPKEILENGRFGYVAKVCDYQDLASKILSAIYQPITYRPSVALDRFRIQNIGPGYISALDMTTSVSRA